MARFARLFALALLLCFALPCPAARGEEWTLSRGQRGEDVTAIQERLRVLGFMHDAADGICGDNTLAGVRIFQQYLSTLDGGATRADGKLTLSQKARLFEAGLPVAQKSPAPDENSLAALRIQHRLNALCYLEGGADGIYGENTRDALRAFQKANGLAQTGVADWRTQRLLFSEAAQASDQPPMPYLLKIDLARQRVYCYGWEKGGYGKLVKKMPCSTGLDETPTPTGTFQTSGPVSRWCYFPKFGYWAQYGTRIRGNILFHSALYTQPNEESASRVSARNLGRQASNGCVRLSVENARWIYENCPAGTTVVVY